jgi:hypothetical protein
MDANNDNASGDANLSTLLRGGGEASDGALDALGVDAASHTKPASRVNIQIVAVVLVLGVAAGVLYWMRLDATRVDPAGEIKAVDYQRSVNPAEEARQKLVLARLEQSEEPVQVPVDSITKNPFQLGAAPAAVPDEGLTDEELAEAERLRQLEEERERRERKVAAAADSLLVGSIMANGRMPCATINGAMVREGDLLLELLRVRRIETDGVWVEGVTGARYVLRPGEPAERLGDPEPPDNTPRWPWQPGG